MKSALRLVLCGVLAGVLTASQAQNAVPEKTEEDHIFDRAEQALWWGDFTELERQHTEYSQAHQLTAAGRPKLVRFRRAVHQIFSGPQGGQEAYFAQMDALSMEWVQAQPNSPLAHVLHAKALSSHAWSYRGTGYASSVPPQAWRDFERYVRLAIEHLAANADVAMRSSYAHLLLLDLGRASGWSLDRLWPIAEAGLQLNPEDDQLYDGVLTAALPKWGGSAQAVDRVIERVVQRTRATHGEIFYARMYAWAAADEFKHRLFEDSGASWPRMKAGYLQWLTRHPSPATTNAFARFACLARDKPQLLDLLEKIGDRPRVDEWGDNGSRTYETCRRWAVQQ